MSSSSRLALVVCALAASGCVGATYPRHEILLGAIVNSTKQTQSVTENAIEPAAKEGEACAQSFAIPIIWLSFAFSNASAKKAATTERVAVIDRSSLGILGVYANSCALVTPGRAGAAPAPADEPAAPVAAPSSTPAPATPDKPITVDATGWPSSVPIASRSTCSFVCIAAQGTAPREADKKALGKALEKHLGALRSCIGGGKSAAGVVVQFDSVGHGIVNYDFGPRTTPRADCPASFPPVKNLNGPTNATWKCTDYCE